MGQTNKSPESNDKVTAVDRTTSERTAVPTETELPRHIKETWSHDDQQRQDAGANEPSSSSYVMTPRMQQGRGTSGMAQPGYGDPQRLLPGSNDRRTTHLPTAATSLNSPNVAERKARLDRMLAEAATLEADLAEEIRSDTSHLKSIVHPSVWAALGPMLERSDNDVVASLQGHPIDDSKRLAGASHPVCSCVCLALF